MFNTYRNEVELRPYTYDNTKIKKGSSSKVKLPQLKKHKIITDKIENECPSPDTFLVIYSPFASYIPSHK